MTFEAGTSVAQISLLLHVEYSVVFNKREYAIEVIKLYSILVLLKFGEEFWEEFPNLSFQSNSIGGFILNSFDIKIFPKDISMIYLF